MTIFNYEQNKRDEFITKCGELLNIANSNLTSCDYILGSEISTFPKFTKNGMLTFLDSDEFVIVHGDNDYHYIINITGYSLIEIANMILLTGL